MIIDYEKKYKEANDKVAARFGDNVAKEIFSDLYESEDERIRKWLLDFVQGLPNEGLDFKFYNLNKEQVIAWLEKQGEQKSNTVLDIEIPFGAKDSELQEVSYYIPEGFHAEIEGDKVVIKKGKQKPIEWKQENREELTEFENAMMHIGGSFFGENAGLDPNDTAVIKEQAELLLELAPKIEWSEEDERMLNLIIQDYEAASKSFCGYKGKLYWLKSFKKELKDKL